MSRVGISVSFHVASRRGNPHNRPRIKSEPTLTPTCSPSKVVPHGDVAFLATKRETSTRSAPGVL